MPVSCCKSDDLVPIQPHPVVQIHVNSQASTKFGVAMLISRVRVLAAIVTADHTCACELQHFNAATARKNYFPFHYETPFASELILLTALDTLFGVRGEISAYTGMCMSVAGFAGVRPDSCCVNIRAESRVGTYESLTSFDPSR